MCVSWLRLFACEISPMETAKDINRWWLNPMRRPLDSVECRSFRWYKVIELWLSRPVRSRRRFSSLDVRSHLPMYCVRRFRECHNGKVSAALLEDRFRCLEDSDDRLSGQTPYIGIDRNRKTFLLDGCRDIVEHIGRNFSLEESLTIVRKLSVQHALVNPFSKYLKVYWPKFKGKSKSIPIFFSHNLLYLFGLQ